MAHSTRMTLADEDRGIAVYGTLGDCDRCDAYGELFEVEGDLPGDWLYCLACARITARVLAV